MRPPIQSTVTILLLTSLLSLLIPSYPKPTSLITSLLSLLIPSYPKLTSTSLITFLLSLLIPSYPKPNSLVTLIWSLITKIISIIQSTLLVPLVKDIYSVVHCRRVSRQADPGFDESRVDSTSQCCSLGPAQGRHAKPLHLLNEEADLMNEVQYLTLCYNAQHSLLLVMYCTVCVNYLWL